MEGIKTARRFTLLLALLVLTGFVLTNAYAAGLKVLSQSGSIGYQFIDVNGDEGRFREDRYMTDDHTGGLEGYTLSLSSDDISLDISAKAIYDYDYALDVDFSNNDSYYVKFNGRQLRKYYDGSNEAWDPTLYNLAPNLADRPDENIFADRKNIDLEIGLFVSDSAQLVIGWNRWGRDGKETLLRGERTRLSGDPIPRTRSAPALATVDGWSDTVYLQLTNTFADKYNFMFKQEFETYDDDQFIIFPRYKDGAVEQFRTFVDEPEFQEWLTTLSFDSFLSEKTYVTANYLFQNLKNTSIRSSIRPDQPNPNHFVNPNVDNQRDAHVATLGVVFLNPLIKDLQLGLNFRAEAADTDASGRGFSGGTTLRISESKNSETRFGESFSLNYRGFKNTTVSFELEAEQRNLNWSEFADTRSHEIFTDFGGPAEIRRDADITFDDISSSFLITTKPFKHIKLTGRYKMANKRRNYDENIDNSASFYPGYLGNMDQNINQASLRLTAGPFGSWVAGLQFSNEENDLSYARQGRDGQQLSIDRVSANLNGSPFKNFVFTLTGMIENYDMETPTSVPAGNDWEDGESIYDYNVDMYLVSATGSYAFSKKLSSYLTYQHTEVAGTVDNSLDEIWLGTTYKFDKKNSLGLRFEFFDFEDQTGKGFDDYNGYSVSLVYNKSF